MFALAKKILHRMDPEAAHTLTIRALKMGLGRLAATPAPREDPVLATSLFGLDFKNPVGLAAGFDKNCDVAQPMLKLGFGFVEAGTVTPLPQAGNPKPRLFRLSEDGAVINRFGFNNDGLAAFKNRLIAAKRRSGIIGANIGANKDASDRIADYVTGLETLYGFCDYFTVNISSPNTVGLRALQSSGALKELVEKVLSARAAKIAGGLGRTPILVKIAPDLTDEDISDIAAIATASDIDGLIVSNTTIARPAALRAADKGETGGLSGRPLMVPSTEILRKIYQATGGKIPLIGVGGIASGEDAYRKIRAGASLVQLYSALVYEGPGLVAAINRDLAAALKRDGYKCLQDAVGADA